MIENAEHLNADCTCITIDFNALCKASEAIVGDARFCRDLVATHPHLLSAQPVFLSPSNAVRMQDIVRSIEYVCRLPQYHAAVLKYAPDIARARPGPIGLFMGYDFHLGESGPQLIEINTNAGGALINAYLLQAQRACCDEMAVGARGHPDPSTIIDAFMSNVAREWRLHRSDAPLRNIAIVDDAPATQFLFPEFVLFQRLFAAHGYFAAVAAPEELEHRDGALWFGDRRLDLVYNRLTDFDLSLPEHTVLRLAYEAGEVALSPNPHAHAIYANKKNLEFLTNSVLLRQWAVPESHIATLIGGIPRTEWVSQSDPDDLWKRRNTLFFKPSSGFGSKAAFRGDKVTRKVWQDILDGDYVAQTLVPPSVRSIVVDGELRKLKVDLRNYTYDGQVQLIAARVYQGQTTNFRTPGGGFAPVFIADGELSCRAHCGPRTPH
jgi:hypothetical protein